MKKITKREALKKWNEFLDDNNGPVTIGLYAYPASKVFEIVDPEAYNFGLHGYLDMAGLDLE